MVGVKKIIRVSFDKKKFDTFLNFVKCDLWCGECGLQNTMWGLNKLMKSSNMKVPDEVREVVNRMGKDKEAEKHVKEKLKNANS